MVFKMKRGNTASMAGTLYRSTQQPYKPKNKPHTKPTLILKPPAASFTAGYKAYLAWIPFFSNPYKTNPTRGLWVNGYKKAERENRMRDLWYMKGRERERRYD